MKKNIKIQCIAFLSIWIFYFTSVSGSAIETNATMNPESHVEKETINQKLSASPVRFLENMGQMTDTDHKPVPFVLFKVSAPGMDVYLTEKGLTYVFVKIEEGHEKDRSIMQTGQEKKEKKIEMSWVNLHLSGASIKRDNIIKTGESVQDFNYFYGHCPDGIYGVKEYEGITVKDVYPGIDWVLYGSNKTGMKYDFVVHPGADPNLVKLIYESEKPLNMDLEGNLHLQTPLGKLTEEAPYCYLQESRLEIPSLYNIRTLDDHHTEVTFQLSPLNREEGVENLKSKVQTLIIDPQLVWATLYGGISFEGVKGTAVDNEGNITAVGYVGGPGFPFQHWGTYNQIVYGGAEHDGFIMRFTNTGILTWATYYGGLLPELAFSVACDAAGNIYVTGWTASPDFPLQNRAGAYNSANGGIFILCFTNTGIRTWATRYGTGEDGGNSISCDGTGNVYVTGYTTSAYFPTQYRAGAYNQTSHGGNDDAIILRFTIMGVLDWATYFGGRGWEEGRSIAFDGSNNVYIAGVTGSLDFPIQPRIGAYNQANLGGGEDAFILRFTSGGTLTWSTYYGDSGGEKANSIACDRSGNVYITGDVVGNRIPTQPWVGAYNQNVFGGGFRDIFILRFTNTGVLSWATFYGGSGDDWNKDANNNLAIDNCGNVYVSFTTRSTNLFTFGNSGCGQYYDPSHNGDNDIFLIKFSNAGAVLWATYFGGNAKEYRQPIALDNNGNLFASGEFFQSSVGTTNTYPLTDPGGGAYFDSIPSGLDESFFAKFVPVYTVSQSQINSTNCLCNGSASVDILTCDATTLLWSTGATTNSITDLCPGTYSVVISTYCRNDTTISFTISGSIAPALTTNTTGPSCNGDNNGSATVNATDGTPPYTYLWETGGTSATENNLAAGTYQVRVTDASNCMDSIIATVIEPSILSVVVNNVKDVCNGIDDGSIDIGVSGGTPVYSYNWSNGATTEDAGNLPAGTYKCIVTDINDCKDSITATVTAPPALEVVIDSLTHVYCGGGNDGSVYISVAGGTPPYGYTWSNGASSEDINNLTAGNYSIIVNDAKGCSVSIDTTLTEPPTIVISFDAVHLLCNNDSNGIATANVTGGYPPYTYRWSSLGSSDATVTNLKAGTYEVLVTDSIDCEQTAIVTINEPAPLVVTLPQDVSLCEGDSIILDATVTGGISPYTYSWDPGGMNNSSITVSPSNTTTYRISVTDANNCIAAPDSVTVTFNALPVVFFTADPESGCAPLCVLFNNTTPNTATANWSFGNGNSGTGSAITNCYTDPGVYSVALTVTDGNGCTNSLSAPDLIEVFPSPVAHFTMTPPQVAPMSTPVLFKDQSIGANHWLWNFGDGVNTTSILKYPIFVYGESGSYTVSLIVTNNDGCTDTTSHTIIIEPVFSIYIPNAFTPDGDGINDSFIPQGAEFIDFEMEIYNRWGEKIYYTANIDRAWDGKSKSGNEIQEGVYVYKIWVKDFKDEIHYYVGNVTLIK